MSTLLCGTLRNHARKSLKTLTPEPHRNLAEPYAKSLKYMRRRKRKQPPLKRRSRWEAERVFLGFKVRSTDWNSSMKIQTCPNCRAEMKIGLAANSRDDTILPWYCDPCGKAWGSLCASREDAAEWCKTNGYLRRVFTETEKQLRTGVISIEDFGHMVPCEVCGAKGTTEVHHWAPHHLFPGEADKWPTGNLCRPCHMRWHQRVTPNMGKKRSNAA